MDSLNQDILSRSSNGLDNEGFEMKPNEKGGETMNYNKRIIPMSPTNKSKSDYGTTSNENSAVKRKNNKPTESAIDTEIEETEKFEELDHDPKSVFILPRLIDGVRLGVYNFVVTNKAKVKIATISCLAGLYIAYFVTAVAYKIRNDIWWDWCDGHGLLIILTALVSWCLFYYHILKRYYGKEIYKSVFKPVGNVWEKLFAIKYMKALAALVVIGAVAAFIVVDAWDMPKRLISAGGAVVMILIGLVFSKHPGRVQWRQVFGGMAVQFVFGLLILRWDGGRSFLDCVSRKVSTFLDFSKDGSDFIYGYLSSGNIEMNSTSTGHINVSIIGGGLFAFQALSVIYFFSFVIGLFYHLGIMTWVVMKVGWVLQVFLGSTAAESMNASANIFLGQTEAPILIKPYLAKMTKSEIHAVMTGGFATIAGGVMAAYISIGVNPGSLLTASVMAAPAALALSKLLYPETQVSKTSAANIKAMSSTKSEGNALDAAAQAASQGFVLIGNIIANIIAVVSFIAFLNSIIAWLGFLVGQEQLSFEWILGKIFVPFAFCIGVDTEDIEKVALLLGLKTVVNEFVAYQRLLTMELTPRSKRIAEYALCSFANFSSVGIQLGGLTTMAPSRRADFSKVVWSALLAGTLTSLLNASIAGTLMSS